MHILHGAQGLRSPSLPPRSALWQLGVRLPRGVVMTMLVGDLYGAAVLPEGGVSDVYPDQLSGLSPSPASVRPMDSAAQPSEAPGPGGERVRRRARRRELHCPLHPEQKLFSVSPKHHLYVTDVGQLMLRGLSKRRADELLAAYRRVLPLTDEWIECFWCEDCASTRWWHVKRHDRYDYSLNVVPRELWEQASGVIRAEGNPTVSQFSRRQARAGGVHGLQQYRFL